MNKKILIPSLAIVSIVSLGHSLTMLDKPLNNDKRVTASVSIPSAPTSKSVSAVTSIDLNDNTDEEIRDYYSSLNSLSDSELRGENLLKNLKSIIHNMYYFSYSDVWKIYEITDRDWNLSPAVNDTYKNTSYNSSSNSYTVYSYGSSASNSGNNPYVRTLYRNRDNTGSTIESGRIREWGSHSIDGTNREHVWPQSRGFKAPEYAEGPAGTDIHHLMSGDAYVNQKSHNNYPYGNVDKTKTYTNAGDIYSYVSNNFLGYSTFNPSSSNQVFEPQDADKGDIARAIFYMAACYNNYANESGAISQYDPFLKITNEIYKDGYSVSSTDTTPVTMGILSDLLEWHRLDPVDEFEIHRNNLIYNNYQGNRNPFIDFPEWVDFVWGEDNENGSANPLTDTINGYNEIIDDDTDVPQGREYTLVTSTSQLISGSNIVIAAKDFNVAMSEQNYNNRAQIDIQKNGDSLYLDSPSNVCEFTLESVGNNWTIFDSNLEGYLYAASSSNNYLRNNKTITDNSKWSINIDNGKAILVAQGDNTRNIIRYNKTNSLFSCYNSENTTMKDIVIYQYTNNNEAKEFATGFLNSITCNGGVTTPNKTKWNEQATIYNALSQSSKTLFSSSASNEYGSEIEQCLARYDYIVSKYGDSEYQDFMNRKSLLMSNEYCSNVNIFNNQIIIIIAISIISSISIFGYLQFRKRHSK